MAKRNKIIIVGAGLVGLATAEALAHLPVDITLIEAKPLDFKDAEQLDRRSLALTYGSKTILEHLGVWQTLAPHACGIDQVHVSEQGGFGVTRVDKEREGLPSLGYIVPFSVIHETLLNAVRKHIDLLMPAQVCAIRQDKTGVTVEVALGEVRRQLKADIVIAADGIHSGVVDLLGCEKVSQDYGQTAVVGNLQLKRPHQHIAYERFTANGPLAILPQPGNYAGFTWVTDAASAKRLTTLPAPEFLAEIQQTFGYRLGKFVDVGKRAAFPLRLQKVKQPVQDRVLIFGNAAHNLHPVAGQGFNLSLRDVAKLAECIEDNIEQLDTTVLQQFQHWQDRDQRATVGITDSMVKVFCSQTPGMKTLRNLGLRFFERQPLARKLLNNQLMGLRGRKSRLERGGS